MKEAMSRVLGGQVWKAIMFYFDMKLVSQDPEVFARMLDKLFGNSSKVLQHVIGETLLSKVGSQAEKHRDREFQDWIHMAKAKFSSSSRLPMGQS